MNKKVEGFLNEWGAVLVTLVLFLSFFVGPFLGINLQEIDSDDYEHVKIWQKELPELSNYISEMMDDDDKISNWEFGTIRREHERLKRKIEKDAINKKSTPVKVKVDSWD